MLPVAKRIITVWVCVVALPPLEAMMGIDLLSVVSLAMESSNSEITDAAAIAVPRFTISHGRRLRAVTMAGANKSSEESTPAAADWRQATSSMTVSRMSSMVIR